MLKKIKQFFQKNISDHQYIDGNCIVELTEDSCVNAVIYKFATRSKQGMLKFGQSIDANKKPTGEWIEDTQEELMDAIIYLERLKTDFKKK